jgi:peptidoglycan hydrolase-like protein with peptidoglycan-binding domain
MGGRRVLRSGVAQRGVVLAPGAGYGRRLGSGLVRGLQHQLDQQGFGSGPVDGLYGPLTTGAVRRFQAAHGLTVDGIAGPSTLGVLHTQTVRRILAVRHRRLVSQRLAARHFTHRLEVLGRGWLSDVRLVSGPVRVLEAQLESVRGLQVRERPAAPAPQTPATPTTRLLSPGLPTTPVLVLLAILGMISALRGYHVTRQRAKTHPQPALQPGVKR